MPTERGSDERRRGDDRRRREAAMKRATPALVRVHGAFAGNSREFWEEENEKERASIYTAQIINNDFR
jgi:hypothetical protein